MARRKTGVGVAQKLAGCGILAVLGLIVVWLLVQQSRFNPAVLVAARPPQPQVVAQTPSGQAGRATAALIPQVSGFTPLAPPESYGPDNLSDKIDGKAELYLQAGFKEMSCRRFRLGEADGASLEVFVYDMGTPAHAFAVFSGQRRPGAAGLALTTHAYATPNALFFTYGHYYVELVADRAGPGLQSSLETFARAVLAKIPAAPEPPDEAGLFPREGLVLDSVRLSAADAFGLEGFNLVYTAEYTLEGGRVTAFIARRATPEQARGDAQKYVDFLTANGYKKVPTPGPAGDFPVLALDDSFAVVMVEGRTLAGVHDAPALKAALETAARLRAALRDKP
ncbi:MAG: hypothetical protein FJ128_05215 [Deltaproteobacteria bacterium]|nr:hypothetical protein [Deltaproteobacteria bacterium]